MEADGRHRADQRHTADPGRPVRLLLESCRQETTTAWTKGADAELTELVKVTDSGDMDDET